MGKIFGSILKVVALVAAVALAIPSGGTSLLAAGLGVSATAAAAITVGLSIGASLLSPKPAAVKNSTSNLDRLRATIDPRAPRKTWIGSTAGNTDIRDEEFTGTQQDYFHRFIVVASHKAHAINEVWFDDKKAWSLTGGVTSDFAGYLVVTPILEGSASNAINISSRMGSSRRYTGCAYVYFRYKLTGNSSKTDSPFSQSITTRITIRGQGAALYDPRHDSTVPGGSGTQRADDQATWVWDDNACRNPALALLFYLLGYKINGLPALGKGIPSNRIDLESFAVAANICDEAVATSAGGTEPRYRCDGTWSEGDQPSSVLDMLKASMNADLDDVDGKIRLTIFHNDLAMPDADFTADDILSDFDWDTGADLSDSFNIVKGAYTDPSDASLYQAVDYPSVSFASPDGIDRIDTFDLPMVESPDQAQRLAQSRLMRVKFGGSFSATFQATAWRVQKNSVCRLTFAPRGWVNKLFRVAEAEVRVDGTVPMVLREEDASIYGAPSLAAPTVALPTAVYNPQLTPVAQALAAAQVSASSSPPSVIVPATANGTPKAGVPGFQVTVLQSATDVTAAAITGYTISQTSGVDDLTGVTHDGSGGFTIMDMPAALSAYIDVAYSYAGATATLREPFTKLRDGTAAIGGSSSIAAPSNSYSVVASVTATMGPNGTVSADGNGSFSKSAGGALNVSGYVEYNLGAGWVTLAGSSFTGEPDIGGSGGSFLFSATVTGASIGLTTSQSVQFQVQMKKSNTLAFSSFSGSFSANWSN